MLGFLLVPAAHAEPPQSVQVEVSFLLGFIEGSGCDFYRNFFWHDSKAAQAHLRVKYKWLAARNLINTTEDFIERAATESSISGQAYQVRCSGSAVVSSKQWLQDELVRLRTYE
jgi:hypothetical protein